MKYKCYTASPLPRNAVATTGVVQHYDFTISRVIQVPDGVARSMLVVNNQFPGPLVEANLGDTIEVAVHNAIKDPEEGTAVHWHGLPKEQRLGTTVQQCPIAPGQTFVYRF